MNVPDYILGPLDADEEFEHEVSASLAPTPIEEDTERDRRGPKDFRGWPIQGNKGASWSYYGGWCNGSQWGASLWSRVACGGK